MTEFIVKYVRTVKKTTVERDIHCIRYSPPGGTRVIFTHGAMGDMASPAAHDFCIGLASPLSCSPGQRGQLEVVGVNGPSHLATRAAYLACVAAALSADDDDDDDDDDDRPRTLFAGRSLGSRAAVLCGSTELICVSFPLLGGSGKSDGARRALLVDLAPHHRVLFVVGTRDAMAELDALQAVRREMRCPSSLLLVQGADHGMRTRGTDAAMQRRIVVTTGELAAHWLRHGDGGSGRSERLLDVRDGKMFVQDWTEHVTLDSEPKEVSSSTADRGTDTQNVKAKSKASSKVKRESKTEEPAQQTTPRRRSERLKKLPG